MLKENNTLKELDFSVCEQQPEELEEVDQLYSSQNQVGNSEPVKEHH